MVSCVCYGGGGGKGLECYILEAKSAFQTWYLTMVSVPVSNLLSIVISGLLVLLTIYFFDFNFSKI